MSATHRWLLRCTAVLPGRRLQLAWSGVVLLFLLGTLWLELNNREQLAEIWQAFVRQMAGANMLWLLAALGLMPFNWLAETRKWHQFVSKLQPLSLRRALLAVWIGVGFSLFTPNRMGEYGGRILLVQAPHRWKAAIANLVGNYSQFLVLLTAGFLGSGYFFSRFGPAQAAWLLPFGWIASAGLLLLYFLFFNLRLFLPLLRRLPLLHRWRFLLREVAVLQYFTPVELAGLLGWSALRYGIYATQYFLLLQFFVIRPDIGLGFAGIATIFLVQTSLPLPPLTGLVARGNLAIWIWHFFGANALSSLSATFVLWIINLILPALIGTFSLFYVNIAKMPGYEDDATHHA